MKSILPRAGVLLTAAVVTAVAAVPANAEASKATVTLADGELMYQAAPGQTNRITIRKVGGARIVTDQVPLAAQAGCRQLTTRSAECPGDLYRVVVHAGDRDDEVRVDIAAMHHIVFGGDGDDKLYAGPATAARLDGERGNDTLVGGSGNDRLYGDAGADQMRGGAGVDVVSYHGRHDPIWADLDGAIGDDGGSDERDSILDGVEIIEGGKNNDFLVGDEGPNHLWGGPGNDFLYGFGGDDHLWGGGETTGEDDFLFGGDGNDTILAGYGADMLFGEDGDDILKGEEGYDTIEGNAGVNTCWPGPDGAHLQECQYVR